MKPIPPAPPDWKLTTADLFAEMKAGKRPSIGSPEFEWATEYERSLLPTDLRHPEKDDVYEAIAPVSVHYLTSWRTAYTGGGETMLQTGERILVPADPGRALSVNMLPVDYRATEKRVIPLLTRLNPLYSDFHFSVDVGLLHRSFRLVT